MEASTMNPRKRPIEEQASELPTHEGLDVDATSSSLLAGDAMDAPSKPAAAAAPRRAAATATATATSADSKAYKGLRHFSMMVCRTVEQKGTTTYNEVADELVERVVHDRPKDKDADSTKYDEKNIRRRVYDALNVLMAMDIITKHKKSISWKGLPTSASQDLDMLQRERDYRVAEIERKRASLQELLQQQVCFRNLTEHNRRHEAAAAAAAATEQTIPLPFIVVNTHHSAVIQCNMSRDKQDVMFDFSLPFEINDDNRILKRMGLHKTSMEVLASMVPPDMLQYCQDHRLLDSMLVSDGGDGNVSAFPPDEAAVPAPPN